jgi:hypothetical protein
MANNDVSWIGSDNQHLKVIFLKGRFVKAVHGQTSMALLKKL